MIPSIKNRWLPRWAAAAVWSPLILLLSFVGVRAQQSPPAGQEILLGQSCALKGPARLLGQNMRDGALAYFNTVNAEGGIRGRQIRLISYDDGYEPDACAANTRKLIDTDGVFLLFGYVGTPTSQVAVPIAVEQKVPFFGPFTGAEFLRHPVIRTVFNVRASYYQETEAMVSRLFEEKKIRRIAVMYQNDAYGNAGLEGVRQALTRRQISILASAAYKRNTTEVGEAVKTLAQADPEAVILIGAYAPCAEFIRQMRSGGSKALFLNVSFVGAQALAADLANAGLGVVITQVVPYPYDMNLPLVVDYQQHWKQSFPEALPGFVSMEGYVAARALCAILKQAPEPLTREGFVETSEQMKNMAVGGFSLGFSKTDHQGSNQVYFTQVGPGGFVAPIERLSDLYEYHR